MSAEPVEGVIASREQILRTNAAMREWARWLREYSETARARSRAGLVSTTSRRRPPLLEEPTVPVSIGEVTVRELVDLLVGFHGFGDAEAARVVHLGLLVSGYPQDIRAVSAADGMEIMQGILGPS